MADRMAAPPWLAPATLRAMMVARDRLVAGGGSRCAAARAAREIVLARHPALPARAIAEAVRCVVPQAAAAAPATPSRMRRNVTRLLAALRRRDASAGAD